MKTFTNPISSTEKVELVSVVITAYNHSRYLPDAIESVLNQSWPAIELIVIDDGSTDNTADIIAHYPQVKYTYQPNKGLPAARNAGALISKGKYVVFLDADDMLYPDAIATNTQYFKQHPDCGFISGGHDLMNDEKTILPSKEWQRFPQKEHYKALLCCDYISMHAAVMYRRDVFAFHQYDETLSACEDYDFYLQVAKDYPVFSHNIKLAAYRKHGNNMSGNVLHMYKSAMKVMRKHKDLQHHSSTKACYRIGKKDIRSHYAGLLLSDLIRGKQVRPYLTKDLFSVLFLLNRKGVIRLGKYSVKRMGSKGEKYALALGRRINRLVKGGSQSLVPRPGNLWIKDLNRTTPFNKTAGTAGGGAIDRYYITEFLNQNAVCIAGNVLESLNASDAGGWGGASINSSKLLINNGEGQPVIIPESGTTRQKQTPQYDCILLVQFLHQVYDYKKMMRFCFQSLKKGGVLLLTVPGISTTGYGGRNDDTPYWNFTGNAINRFLAEYFNPADIRVTTYGNVLAATALLHGIGASALTPLELSENDPNYQVIVAAKVTKHGEK